jgi:hypothetical protein
MHELLAKPLLYVVPGGDFEVAGFCFDRKFNFLDATLASF